MLPIATLAIGTTGDCSETKVVLVDAMTRNGYMRKSVAMITLVIAACLGNAASSSLSLVTGILAGDLQRRRASGWGEPPLLIRAGAVGD